MKRQNKNVLLCGVYRECVARVREHLLKETSKEMVGESGKESQIFQILRQISEEGDLPRKWENQTQNVSCSRFRFHPNARSRSR